MIVKAFGLVMVAGKTKASEWQDFEIGITCDLFLKA